MRANQMQAGEVVGQPENQVRSWVSTQWEGVDCGHCEASGLHPLAQSANAGTGQKV